MNEKPFKNSLGQFHCSRPCAYMPYQERYSPAFPMIIELVNTGTELLLGDVVNTNAAWLGQQLAALGLRIDRQTVVPDGVPV